MSWTKELYKVYEQQCGVEHNDGTVLLPVSHSTANAQIEVTLRQDGSFVAAKAVTKEEGLNTIIPVTEDSGGRTSGVCAMPFADKLIYLCGDYAQYTGKDNAKYVQAYLEQLGRWHDSPYTHPAVDAVYAFISQGTLMKDLIDEHVLKVDEETGKLAEKVNIAGIAQEDAFVRFRVFGDMPETWLDQSLYDCFIAWNSSESDQTGLCYATGETSPITYKHPSKLRNTGDKAKLISANDESGFTYRGRFADKTEAISVSYDFSQKMHNALRWLIQRQGISVQESGKRKESMQFDTLQLIVWTSSLADPPSFLNAACDPDDDEYFGEPVTRDTEPLYRDFLRKRLFGTKSFDVSSKVMLMGVDAATTGRLSVAIYEELEQSRLLNNLTEWHAETAALRFYAKQKITCPNSFAVKEIISCAYGLENGKGFLEAKPEIVKDNVLRLLPCITQGRKLPADIVQNLVKKASNPLAYKKEPNKPDNFRLVLETACGMIRKYNIDRKEGVISMAFDPNETDRSYLFGCLLAVADWAERTSYEKSESQDRITNAKRYWSRFVQRPSETWAYLYDKLIPYLNRLQKNDFPFYKKFNEMVSEIKAKFTLEDFSDNSPLSPAYLLGYHHFNAEIYRKKEEE